MIAEPSQKDPSRRPLLLRVALLAVGLLLTVIALVYVVRALDSRNLNNLGLEHTLEFEAEFSARQEAATDWTSWLEIEAALATELDAALASAPPRESPVDRYAVGSLTSPAAFGGDWNRSYELTVPAPRGVAVLLHGLSDSPYSMLATAQTLAGHGFNVTVIRMPGHGFAVSALRQTRWEDWTAAVRIGVRRAMARPGADGELLIAGYSNGGLLAIDYALHCERLADLRCPDRLLLLSPGVAVSPAARVANWHRAVSWLPGFDKFAWLAVLPEVDPFKFTSFPKRPGWEMHQLAVRVRQTLQRLPPDAKLPPILTFQSLLDDTVGSTAVVSALYDRLPANGSHLFLYDMNRNSTMRYLMADIPPPPMAVFEQAAPLNFGVTILGNTEAGSNDVVTVTLPSGELETRSKAAQPPWPASVYSLSHIAIPFRPDDPLYGDGRDSVPWRSPLVAIAPRGERNALTLGPDYFLRIRYNPFYAVQTEFLTEWLNQ